MEQLTCFQNWATSSIIPKIAERILHRLSSQDPIARDQRNSSSGGEGLLVERRFHMLIMASRAGLRSCKSNASDKAGSRVEGQCR
jgi:hypothetical protein